MSDGHNVQNLGEGDGIFETPKNQRFRQMRQKMVVDRAQKRSELVSKQESAMHSSIKNNSTTRSAYPSVPLAAPPTMTDSGVGPWQRNTGNLG